MGLATLGISAYYHDSAAALVVDGEIVAAAQEERYTRKKHDAGFPAHAAAYCLAESGLRLDELASVVFYEKPFLKFERLLETYMGFAPRGIRSFLAAMPVWLHQKLNLKRELKNALLLLPGPALTEDKLPPLLFTEHHQSHAASAYYASPYEKAAVLCIDGVGEWATTSVWLGEGASLTPRWQINFPHSLGLLYTAFTYYTGFKVNSGEYKVMGLAPYGEPRYAALIKEKLVDIRDDGTFALDMSYFNFATGLTMTGPKFHALFGGPPRRPESPLGQREMDLARSIQDVTDEIMLRLARTIHTELGVDYLCLAGGVALNCVANGRVLREGPFKDIYIQPAAGDAGGALGAALVAQHQHHKVPRRPLEHVTAGLDRMKGAYLGPRPTNIEIQTYLDKMNAPYEQLETGALNSRLAELLEGGAVVGLVQGRMEFGPRALGGRSIVGDARNPKMQSVMNLKIKYRESFRPFAPAVLAHRVSDYFVLDRPSPYMLLVAPVAEKLRAPQSEADQKLFGIERLHLARSTIPAVTHLDYSARVQTVHRETNPRFFDLLTKFEARTGCAVLVNTSFNVRGEPIVCTPEDAYRCFMRTEMDYLVLEDFLIEKSRQPELPKDAVDWQKEFELD